MNKIQLEKRTKEFSLILIRFLQSLPKNYLGEAMGKQLLKSGTSIGANYREANRAESKAYFIHKLAVVEKEASETLYWLELLLEAGIGAHQEAIRLMQEAKELLAIFTAAGRTSKRLRRLRIPNLEYRNPKFKMNQPSGGSRPSAMARRRLMGNCSENVSAASNQRSFSIRVILIPFCNMVRSAPS